MQNPRWKRTGELTLGHIVNAALTYCFDYVLYPLAIWKLGPWVGGGIMAGASLVICLCLLWFYDWSGRDWLGIEAVKSLREEGSGPLRKILARVLPWGDVSAFLALSIYFDGMAL